MFMGVTPTILRPLSVLSAILKPQDVFAILAQPANAMQAAVNALPFSADLLIGKDRVAAGDWAYRDSLRGLNLTLASNDPKLEGAWPGYSGTNNRVEYASKIGAKFLAVGTFTHTTGTATNIDLSSLGTVGDAVVKRRDAAGDWYAWHRSLTAGNNLRLNTTDAQSATNAFVSVSGTTLTFSASAPSGNYTYQAHAHDPSADGIVQCGSAAIASNGSVNISLPWLTQWIMIKRTDSADQWYIIDASRGFSPTAKFLYANLSNAEVDLGFAVPVSSSGITIPAGQLYGSAGSLIFAAIRAPY